MKKLDLVQMENLQGGSEIGTCHSITIFGWGYHWGNNQGGPNGENTCNNGWY